MWRQLWKSMLVGEEKPAAGINASSSGKCQQIDFSGIAARPEWVNWPQITDQTTQPSTLVDPMGDKRFCPNSHTNADIICLEYSMFNDLKYLNTILMASFICLYRSSLKNCHVKFISPINPPTRKHKSQQNPQLLPSPQQLINKFSIISSKGNTAYMEWVLINSLGPNNAIWWQRSGSTFAQVMACCLTAPSHYLNQCWLIKSKVLWHSSKGNFAREILQPSIIMIILNNIYLKFNSNHSAVNELTQIYVAI